MSDVTIAGITPANRALALDDKLEIETSGTAGRYITGQEIIDRVNSNAQLEGTDQVTGLDTALAAINADIATIESDILGLEADKLNKDFTSLTPAVSAALADLIAVNDGNSLTLTQVRNLFLENNFKTTRTISASGSISTSIDNNNVIRCENSTAIDLSVFDNGGGSPPVNWNTQVTPTDGQVTITTVDPNLHLITPPNGTLVLQAGDVAFIQKVAEIGIDKYWIVYGVSDLSGAYVPISGGTMTGALILAADPVVPLGAATSQFVAAMVADLSDDILALLALKLNLSGGTVSGIIKNASDLMQLNFTGDTALLPTITTQLINPISAPNGVWIDGIRVKSGIIYNQAASSGFHFNTVTGATRLGTVEADLTYPGNVAGDRAVITAPDGSLLTTNVTVADLETIAFAGQSPVITENTASRTLALSDANKTINVTYSSGDCTITIPTNVLTAIPLNSRIRIINSQGSTRLTTFSTSGITLNGPSPTIGNGGYVELLKYDTNTWMVTDIYEALNTTFSMTTPWGAGQSWTVYLTRNGREVTFSWANFSGASSSGVKITGTGVIPARFRPIAGDDVFPTHATSNSATVGGAMRIATNGNITASSSFPAEANYAATGNAALWCGTRSWNT
jgi:hypothetical protein